MPERARKHLESLKAVRDELERVKADADTLIDRVSTDLERAEADITAPQPPKQTAEKSA